MWIESIILKVSSRFYIPFMYAIDEKKYSMEIRNDYFLVNHCLAIVIRIWTNQLSLDICNTSETCFPGNMHKKTKNTSGMSTKIGNCDGSLDFKSPKVQQHHMRDLGWIKWNCCCYFTFHVWTNEIEK